MKILNFCLFSSNCLRASFKTPIRKAMRFLRRVLLAGANTVALKRKSMRPPSGRWKLQSLSVNCCWGRTSRCNTNSPTLPLQTLSTQQVGPLQILIINAKDSWKRKRKRRWARVSRKNYTRHSKPCHLLWGCLLVQEIIKTSKRMDTITRCREIEEEDRNRRKVANLVVNLKTDDH